MADAREAANEGPEAGPERDERLEEDLAEFDDFLARNFGVAAVRFGVPFAAPRFVVAVFFAAVFFAAVFARYPPFFGVAFCETGRRGVAAGLPPVVVLRTGCLAAVVALRAGVLGAAGGGGGGGSCEAPPARPLIVPIGNPFAGLAKIAVSTCGEYTPFTASGRVGLLAFHSI